MSSICTGLQTGAVLRFYRPRHNYQLNASKASISTLRGQKSVQVEIKMINNNDMIQLQYISWPFNRETATYCMRAICGTER